MKKLNWQTKALTLFIATAALCLATACSEPDAADTLGLASCEKSDNWAPLRVVTANEAIWRSDEGPVTPEKLAEIRNRGPLHQDDFFKAVGVYNRHEDRFRTLPESIPNLKRISIGAFSANTTGARPYTGPVYGFLLHTERERTETVSQGAPDLIGCLERRPVVLVRWYSGAPY